MSKWTAQVQVMDKRSPGYRKLELAQKMEGSEVGRLNNGRMGYDPLGF